MVVVCLLGSLCNQLPTQGTFEAPAGRAGFALDGHPLNPCHIAAVMHLLLERDKITYLCFWCVRRARIQAEVCF